MHKHVLCSICFTAYSMLNKLRKINHIIQNCTSRNDVANCHNLILFIPSFLLLNSPTKANCASHFDFGFAFIADVLTVMASNVAIEWNYFFFFRFDWRHQTKVDSIFNIVDESFWGYVMTTITVYIRHHFQNAIIIIILLLLSKDAQSLTHSTIPKRISCF